MTCTLEIEIEVYREYDSSENVSVDGRESKEATLTTEIETVEECLKIIEGKRHEVVRMVWDEVKDTREFEEFGWGSPYPRGDISLSPSNYESMGPTIHDIVDRIGERDNVSDKTGIYYHLMNYSNRVEVNERRFLEYLAEEKGIDTSYYTHGVSPE